MKTPFNHLGRFLCTQDQLEGAIHQVKGVLKKKPAK